MERENHIMDKKRQSATKIQVVEYIVLLIVCLFLFLVMMQLFYRQSIKFEGRYQSDLPAHIEFALEGRGYSLLYWLIGVFYRITNNTLLVAASEALMIVITFFLTGKLFQLLLESQSYAKSVFLAIPSTFLTSIYLPLLWQHYYKQSLITQPYHNITYYGMRVFAVCVMIFFTQMLNGYLKKISWKNWILLSFFLMLSTAVKPNFLLGYAFTLLIFLLLDFIKYKFAKEPFIHMIFMGLTVVPSILVLLWQAMILYGKSSDGSGIGLDLGRSFIQYGIGATILKLICSLVFPILILIVNRRRLRRIDKFIALMFGVQLAVCVIFVETGTRASAANFYWGLYCAGFFLFVSTVSIFIKNCKSKMPYGYLAVGAFLLLAHLVSSVGYFLHIFAGGYHGV